MENKLKFVSMYEITKMKFKGLNEFEKELMFEEWIKRNNKMESKEIDFEKGLKETAERMRSVLQDTKENFIELPLKVYISYGKVWMFPSYEDEDEIMYELFLSKDAGNGKLSIQYRGENGTFLSHKQIIKAIKKENYI